MAITKESAIAAIDVGITAANKKYENWSNGLWVTDSGIEGLMVAYIAEALNKRQEKHESLMMELSFRDITNLANATPMPGPRPATITETKRADIVLFNGSNHPTCVIEVKRSWNSEQCLKDLARLRDLVRRLSHAKGGSLRRGFLAMSIAKQETSTKSPEDRINEQTEKILKIVEGNFSPKGQNIDWHLGTAIALGKTFQKIYGNWKVASFCIEIYSPRYEQ